MAVVRLLEMAGRQAQSKMIVRPERGSGREPLANRKGWRRDWFVRKKGKVRHFRLGCQRDSRRAEGAVATSEGMRMLWAGKKDGSKEGSYSSANSDTKYLVTHIFSSMLFIMGGIIQE